MLDVPLEHLSFYPSCWYHSPTSAHKAPTWKRGVPDGLHLSMGHAMMSGPICKIAERTVTSCCCISRILSDAVVHATANDQSNMSSDSAAGLSPWSLAWEDTMRERQ